MQKALWLLLAVPTACVGEPTRSQPRPLSAPVQSARRVFDLWLGPTAMARDARELARGVGRFAREESHLPTARRTAAQLLTGQGFHRELGGSSRRIALAELDRFVALAHSRGFAALDPRPHAAALADDLHRLGSLLGLDRRPLSEPEDLEHRTDPADDRPEPGLGARLWRRLFP